MDPTFIVVGVCKGGTTSMIHHFNLHEEIFMAPNEPHFFDNNKAFDQENNCNLSTYRKLFSVNKKIRGEKTPAYVYLRNAMDRIHKHYPNIKLVLVLREPIQRAYSQYNMNVENKNTREPFLDLIKQEQSIQLREVST